MTTKSKTKKVPLVFDHQKLKEKALSETGFLFDPSTGFTYSLNPVAIAIFKGLQENEDRERILHRLNGQFDGEGATIEQDYDDFIYRLRELGVLVARQVEDE